MKQYEDGYNVNGYSWENETIEYLLNDKQLTDNHIPEWVKKNEIAAFWFWLVIINTDPKLLGVRNELGFNTAMMGLIPAGSIPITTIPSDHEMRLDVISKWINALILDNQSDWFISTMHQNWLQIEKRNEAKWLKKNTEQLEWAWKYINARIPHTYLSWFYPVSDNERYIAIVVLLKILFPADTPYSQLPKVFHYGVAAKEKFFDKMHNAFRKQFTDGKKDKRVQINVKISSDAKRTLDRLTRELKTTQQAVLEHLIQNHRLVIQNHRLD